MLNLTRQILRTKTPSFAFSTLIIPSPNAPSSDLGPLLSASSHLSSPVDVFQICSSDRTDSVISEISSIISADSVNAIHIESIEGLQPNSYFGCMDHLKSFVSENKSKYTHIVMGNGTLSKEMLPRLACANDSQCISDVISVVDPHTFKRPIYAGNAVSTVKAQLSSDSGTIDAKNFDPKINIRCNFPGNPEHKLPETAGSLSRLKPGPHFPKDP